MLWSNPYYQMSDKQLSDVLDKLAKAAGSQYSPHSTTQTLDDKYVVAIDLPGVNPKLIKVEVIGDSLVVSGTRYGRVNGKEMDRSFKREFGLPEDCNTEGISAASRDGVLTVTIPRIRPKTAKPRVIPVA